MFAAPVSKALAGRQMGQPSSGLAAAKHHLPGSMMPSADALLEALQHVQLLQSLCGLGPQLVAQVCHLVQQEVGVQRVGLGDGLELHRVLFWQRVFACCPASEATAETQCEDRLTWNDTCTRQGAYKAEQGMLQLREQPESARSSGYMLMLARPRGAGGPSCCILLPPLLLPLGQLLLLPGSIAVVEGDLHDNALSQVRPHRWQQTACWCCAAACRAHMTCCIARYRKLRTNCERRQCGMAILPMFWHALSTQLETQKNDACKACAPSQQLTAWQMWCWPAEQPPPFAVPRQHRPGTRSGR